MNYAEYVGRVATIWLDGTTQVIVGTVKKQDKNFVSVECAGEQSVTTWRIPNGRIIAMGSDLS